MTFYAILKAIVLPPGVLALAGLLGLLLRRRAPRLGFTLIAVSVLATGVLGMPATAGWLARPLEHYPPFEQERLRAGGADAIVVLGGGAYQDAPEFNGFDDVSRLTLERLRYGARLHRATGIDLAVTGGKPSPDAPAEAVLMETVLETDLGVPVRWIEDESRSTAENARFSRRRFDFDRIVLVTHAVHMPRAVRAFEDAGFEVLPAPMGFISRAGGGHEATDFLPGARGFEDSAYAIYEWFGGWWYRWH